MSHFVPLHDTPPYYANPPKSGATAHFPRYAAPDLDVTVPLLPAEMSESESEQGYEDHPGQGGYQTQVEEAGPSRKRPRNDEHEGTYGHAAQSHNGHGQVNGHDNGHHARPQARSRRQDVGIVPSFFGLSARSEFTKSIGEFILNAAHGKENVEIEIKLGTLMATTQPHEQPRRLRMPTMSEMILPVDYPIGGFQATMTKHQNMTFNQLLNGATQTSNQPQSPFPIQFFRAKQIDTFYSISSSQRGGGKVRVSRDKAGNVIEGGVIIKKNEGNLNVYSPRTALDWRVSVSTEQPCEMPTGPPTGIVREKDRACYRHQLCQVDLTVVTQRSDNTPPIVSYEVEIEILDAPSFLAAAADPDSDRFDNMLLAVLDTARMIIRNV